MRGEYSSINLRDKLSQELPPHARRIRLRWLGRIRCRGTTSACAENTPLATQRRTATANYLRMRGEYYEPSLEPSGEPELPPHARRIRKTDPTVNRFFGTTSACAENTPIRTGQRHPRENYLRMRGEYPTGVTSMNFGVELPPHARRIRGVFYRNIRVLGTTSACAENTVISDRGWQVIRNYLRMRGEYGLPPFYALTCLELPPHARRILCTINCAGHVRGTTSACAENTNVAPKPSI